MTAALPNESPLLVWLAHHHLKVGVAGIGLFFASLPIPSDLAWLGVAVVASALLAGFLFGIDAAAIHTGLFCDYCMARITADGAGEAARRARTLRFVHHEWRRTESAAYVVMVAAPYVGWLVGVDVLRFLGMPLLPWMAWSAWTVVVHRRLQPWCPQCRRRRGDDRDETPSPQPVPEGVAP